MTTKEVAEIIKQQHFKNKPAIIAIDGFGGAGKTTFARGLKTVLRSAAIVEVDDFFLFGVKSDANKSNFDRVRLKQQVLIPLAQNKSASYQKSIDIDNPLSEYFDVPEIEYLILEGVSSFHPDIAAYIDYKIWLDISADHAMKRMMNRDKSHGQNHGEKLWSHWTDSYQDYKDLYHPETLADLIVKQTP